MKIDNEWQSAIEARLPKRVALEPLQAYEAFWSDLPKEAVLDVLNLIETEYGLCSGLLRPEDRLNVLFDPVPTRNPFKWLFFQSRTEDRHVELNYELTKRLKKNAGGMHLRPIITLRDYVEAWAEGA